MYPKPLLVMACAFMISSGVHAQDQTINLKHEPGEEMAALPYLANHGTFLLDDHDETSFSDDRNPLLIIADTDETPNSEAIFYFFFSLDPSHPDYERNAEDCRYQYVGSRPDPFYFPRSKGSVWDLFALAPEQPEACEHYAHLAIRSPHGDYPDMHMHFRYGDSHTSFSDILSKKFSDPESPYAWWSSYEATALFTPSAPPQPYLSLNGDFTMDSEDEATLTDSRNPSRIALYTSADPYSESQFVFYAHNDVHAVQADCNYQYVRSAPDPYYFPEYKTSVWDLFKLTSSNSGHCQDFHYVIFRSPHGDDTEAAHLHLRYGGEGSSFDELLEESLQGDAAWWSTYVHE